MIKKIQLLALLLLAGGLLSAQTSSDTMKTQSLREINIKNSAPKHWLPA